MRARAGAALEIPVAWGVLGLSLDGLFVWVGWSGLTWRPYSDPGSSKTWIDSPTRYQRDARRALMEAAFPPAPSESIHDSGVAGFHGFLHEWPREDYGGSSAGRSSMLDQIGPLGTA